MESWRTSQKSSGSYPRWGEAWEPQPGRSLLRLVSKRSNMTLAYLMLAPSPCSAAIVNVIAFRIRGSRECRLVRVDKTYWFPGSSLYNKQQISHRNNHHKASADAQYLSMNNSMLNLRGNGGKICFRAEAWKATACDTPTFRRRRCDRGARVCRSNDGHANEAIVIGVVGRDEGEASRLCTRE